MELSLCRQNVLTLGALGKKAMRNWVVVFLFTVSGCAGHLRYVGPEVAELPADQRPVAYVLNSEMKQEMAVLEASSIYKLSSDPSTPSKIRLEPMERMLACGNPLIGSMFTLGLMPVHLPDGYTMRFSEEGPLGKKEFAYVLNMHYRYSLWERFYIFSNEDKELGAAVRAAALAKRE